MKKMWCFFGDGSVCHPNHRVCRKMLFSPGARFYLVTYPQFVLYVLKIDAVIFRRHNMTSLLFGVLCG